MNLLSCGWYLFFFAVFSICSAKSVVMETKKVSIRKQLIKSGNLEKYLKEFEKQRLVTSNSQTGTQGLINYYDDFYLGTVSVGTPSNQFTLVMDTGSSDLWLIGSNCSQPACYGSLDYKKNRYNYQLSGTFHTLNKPFTIQYGSGNCKGIVGSDTVSFAGFTIPQQDIGVAYQIADVFEYQPMDGIFGMAWPSISATTANPPLQNILPQLDYPIFTVYMGRETSSNQGRITYGGFDTQFCDSTVNYVQLTANRWWIFNLDAFSIGKYSYKSKSQAITDTGTSWIGAPKTVVDGVVKQLGATYSTFEQMYTIPCSKQNSAPPLYFTINGISYDIDPIDYILDLDLGGGKCAVTFFTETALGFGPQFTLGDTFIRGFCNTYDIGQARVGFSRVSARGPPKSSNNYLVILNIVISSFLYYVFH